jgi:hypothetical protein
MLYRNGENLKKELLHYLSNKNRITIFSPYIKATVLLELLDSPNLNCEQVIVRWDPKDIAMGSSDLEVYKICKDRNITLFINNRIHLKLYTNDFKDALLGSSNISARAISEQNNHFNYEVSTYVESISREDRLYLNRIIQESIFVTDEIYDVIKHQIPDITPEIENINFEFPEASISSSDFLITKLPMIHSPTLLWELYSGMSAPESLEEENCLCHDLALYNISTTGMTKEEFISNITINFLELPFVISFLKEIDKSSSTGRNGGIREGLSFGAVRRWFSENTTTAPAPRPFDLTINVQILYTWIEFITSGKYSVTVPGRHSQVIKMNH